MTVSDPSNLYGPFYKIKIDEQTVGYLLGTIHAADPESLALHNKIKNSFQKASHTAFETTDDYPPYTSCSNLENAAPVLAPERVEDLLQKIAEYEKKVDQMDLQEKIKIKFQSQIAETRDSANYLPLLAIRFMMLSKNMAQLESGLDPDDGIDSLLKKEAALANKSIHGLDEIEDLKKYDDFYFDFYFSKHTQQRKLDGYLSGEFFDMEVRDIKQILKWWKEGNPDAHFKYENFIDSFVEESETILQMDQERNLHMAQNAKKIFERLQDKERLFIAVGSAHLSGDKSVITELKSFGYQVIKIESAPFNPHL